MVICRAALLLILAASFTCRAQTEDRWAMLGKGTDGTEIYLDSKTLDRSDGIVRVWVKYVYPGDWGKYEPQLNITIKKQIQREEFHCKAGRSAVLSYVAYNSKNDVVSAVNYEEPLFTEAIPESIAEIVSQTVCR